MKGINSGAGDTLTEVAAPAPPRILTFLYAVLATALLAAYAYTLWTNQNDPGRAYAWIVKARTFVDGTR